MKIKMLETTPGSPDGITLKIYEKGNVYDLNDDLANCFFEMGVCELHEEKAIEAAPENKAVEFVENRKGKRSKK